MENEIRLGPLRELDIFIGGVRIPITVDVTSLRSILGLPQHDLMRDGIFGTVAPPLIPLQSPNIPDFDHEAAAVIQTLGDNEIEED